MDNILIELPSIIGGILLLVGAILISEFGKIYEASILYLLADVCWIWIALESGGFGIGVIMVIIGTTAGLRTFYKMHKNIYFKNLNKGEQ